MKLVYKIGLASLLSGICFGTQAQSVNTEPIFSPLSRASPKWVVKFAPFSLIDFSNTVQFAVERVVGQQQTIQAEFGYGWAGMNLWRYSKNSRYDHYETWRARAEWRFYWRRFQPPFGAYTALEGLYKQENAFETGTIGVAPDGGMPQYYRLYSLPISKQVWAMTLKFGRQFSFSSNNRLIGDFYGGIGFRTRDIHQPNRPDGYVYYASKGFLVDPFSPNPPVSLNISYGFKIGYAF